MRIILLFVLALLGAVARPALAENMPAGALARYVRETDPSYQWKKRGEGKLGAVQYAELTLTSQTWRDIVWKHQLFVLKPASTPADVSHALLFIAGGNWNPDLERPGDTKLPKEATLLATLAEQLKTPIAVLLQVPQQPIFDGKREDQIIAYTFDQYLRTGDDEWPLLLPMVKSAARGMDAVQEYCQQSWAFKLQSFTICGGSKRGWTTWLTGAVDARATAIAPMVIDVLNMADQMRHQREVWGDVSYKINDYKQRGLTEKLESPEAASLRRIVDPYSYRELLKQPKLIVLGTNDPYWAVDALNLYWKDLHGPKYILYVPNRGHDVADYPRLLGSLNALHQHAVTGRAMPKLTWDYESNQDAVRLQISSDISPVKVQTWIAHSTTQDFREARWEPFSATKNGAGFDYRLASPDSGYSAVFGEAIYEPANQPAFYLSTNIQVLSAKK